MSKILSGKEVRDEIAKKLRREIGDLKTKPALVIIQIGNLPESNAYIAQKKLFAERIGAKCTHLRFPDSITEKKLISKIKNLNIDKSTHGIIVQMPIPKRLDKKSIIESIDPVKDVDGLHSENIKKLWENRSDYVPATARGILSMLKYYGIAVKGRRVMVIGRSALVGRPTATLMLNNDATVIIGHSKTIDMAKVTRQADILIVAAGAPKLIGARHVRAGQVIIDVGINVLTGRMKSKKLEDEISAPKMVGDVDFPAVSKIVKAISPVPGGVGPMTVASLFENLVDAYKSQKSIKS